MSEKVIAVKGGFLIDGTGATPLEDSVVLLKEDKIVDVGNPKEVNVPEKAKIIDAKGKTVMPGMMDLHVHLCQLMSGEERRAMERVFCPHSLSLLYGAKHARQMLEAGFTTVRELLHNSYPVWSGRDHVSLRTAIERGVLKGARLFVAGLIVPTASHHDLIKAVRVHAPIATHDGVVEVRKATRICMGESVDWIKTVSTGGMAGSMLNQPGDRNYTYDELKVIVDEAHARGVKVAAHSEGIVGCRNAVDAGLDTLEHATELDDELIEDMLKKDISITMTMAVSRYQEEVLGTKSSYLPKLLDGRPFSEVGRESHKRAIEAGVNIAMGSDCGGRFPPGANAYELDIYIRELGMSPMDAILTATRNSAKALGRLNDMGTIEEGKIADLIIVDGNPLKDIKVLQDLNRIKVVIKEGKIEVDRR